jgi:hypothetical protein
MYMAHVMDHAIHMLRWEFGGGVVVGVSVQYQLFNLAKMFII